MIGIGLADKSGYLEVLLTLTIKKVPKKLIYFTVVFAGLVFTAIGDGGFIVLPPLAAIIFINIKKNPLVGIFLSFAGAAIGFCSGFFVGMNDILLSSFTNPAAQILEPTFQKSPTMTIYFNMANALLQIFIITWVTIKFIEPRFPVNEEHFKDKEFVPLAPRFAGWFDGNNKRIFNININTEKKNYISKEYGYKVDYEVQKPKFNKYVSFGLFDELLENSKVTDLVLEDITYDNSQVLYKDYEEVKEIKKFGLIAREIQKDAKITNITLNNINLTYLSHLPYAVENQSGLDTGAGLLCGVSKGEITNIHISNVKATFINRSNSGMAFGLVAGNATNIVQNITIKSSELNVLCDERRLLHMDKLETGSDKDDYKMADLKKFSGKKYNTYAGLVCGYMESSEETHFGFIYLKDNKVNFNTEEKTFQKDNEKEY
mgnify:CR=1 FL=1